MLSSGRQERMLAEAVTNGFPLKPEILLDRSYNRMHSTPIYNYVLLLERLDGTKFTVTFAMDELTMAQAYDSELLWVSTARLNVEQGLKELKKEDFEAAIEEWHLGDTDTGVSLKKYMNMTDEEYSYWEETGNMPESWEA